MSRYQSFAILTEFVTLAVLLKPLLGRVVCPREIWGLTEDHTVVFARQT